MKQKLVILGSTGKVGKTLVRQIYDKQDVDPVKHANPTQIVGMASSKNFIFNPDGIEKQEAELFVNKKHPKAKKHKNCSEILKSAKGNENLVFVDVTAVKEEWMKNLHLKIIEETDFSVVTANKNPLALFDYDTFRRLTRYVYRYGYSCSVMAGAGAIPFTRDLPDLGDGIKRLEGCFSGTLGYICSELEVGKKFSEILRAAMCNGYTEPDPRDDLNGLDVARKLVVLARTARHKIGIEDVKVEPFIPKKYLKNEPVDEFLKSIPEIDDYFKKLVADAKSNGKVLRYVAELSVSSEVSMSVGLKAVKDDSAIGSLRGTANKLVLVTGDYPDEYEIRAPGAGLVVTARNIRRDLLYLIQEREIKE